MLNADLTTTSVVATAVTAPRATVSTRVLFQLAILLIQVRNLLLELLYVSRVVLGLNTFQVGIAGPCMCVFGATQIKLGLFDFLYQCRCLLFQCGHLLPTQGFPVAVAVSAGSAA